MRIMLNRLQEIYGLRAERQVDELLSKNSGRIYSYTTESIEAVTNALEAEGDDKVIAICGSGAQPLALLENLGDGGHVAAVDFSKLQFEWTDLIKKLVEFGRKEKLAEVNISPKERNWFMDDQRLASITASLDKLSFEMMDVSERPTTNQRFSKGYFSNAPVNLKYFHPIFVEGALVHVAYCTSDLPDRPERFLDVVSTKIGEDVRKLYELDVEKTEEACRIEASRPVIYHKCLAEKHPYGLALFYTPAVFRRL